jgi:hypothetical protein
MRQEHFILCFIGLLVGAYGWHRSSRWYQGMKTRRRFSRAHKKEAEAALILEGYGYRVLGAQVEGSIELTQDGAPLSASLRADYWVEKGGRSFIAEAKSGSKVINVLDRGTRRQLLEYLVAYEVDGVLLVNTEDRVVSEVCFPGLQPSVGSSRFGVGVLVGVGGYLLWQLLFGSL